MIIEAEIHCSSCEDYTMHVLADETYYTETWECKCCSDTKIIRK